MFFCGAKGHLKELANSVIELIADEDGSFLVSISRSEQFSSNGTLPGGLESSYKNLPGFDTATCSSYKDIPGIDSHNSMEESSRSLNTYEQSTRTLDNSFSCGAKEILPQGLSRLEDKYTCGGSRYDKRNLSGLARLDNRYSCMPELGSSNSSICSYGSSTGSSTSGSSYYSMDEMQHVTTVHWTTEDPIPELDESELAPPARVEPAARGEIVPVVTTMEEAVKNLKQEKKFQCNVNLDLLGGELFDKCNENMVRTMLNANGGKLKFAVFGEEAEGPSVSKKVKVPTAINVVQKLVEVVVAHR